MLLTGKFNFEDPAFVLDNVFNNYETKNGGTVYWRECAVAGSGYIIVWPDGVVHHTHRYPPDFVEEYML